jgi:hypothetical protein
MGQYEIISDYLNHLDFDCIETYSSLRGMEFETFYHETELRISQIQREMKSMRYMQIQHANLEVNKLKDSLNETLIFKKEIFHQTVKKVSKFEKDSKIFNDIKANLLLPCTEEIAYMCAPIYRDLLLFYKQNLIVCEIHICFTCHDIIISTLSDKLWFCDETYESLSLVLKTLGHEMNWNDDGHFRRRY